MSEKLKIHNFINASWTIHGYDFERASLPGYQAMRKISIIPVFKITQEGGLALIYHFSSQGAVIERDRFLVQDPNKAAHIANEAVLAVTIAMKGEGDSPSYEETHYFSFNSPGGEEIEIYDIKEAKRNAVQILGQFLTTDHQKRLLDLLIMS